MSLRWHPIAMVLMAGGCATVVLVTPTRSPERIVAALLLALALPGMAIVGLPTRGSGAIGRLLLALGTSIAVLILDSALLYLLGVRLDLASWAWSLEAITVFGVLARILGRPPRGRPPRGGPSNRRARLQGSTLRLSFAPVSLCGTLVAAALAAAVLVTSHSVLRNSGSDHFTQLWALPTKSGAGRITVGLYNHQGATRRYRLELRRHGRLLERKTVWLRSGETWAMTIGGLPATGPIRISALSTGRGRVYRWVKLRLPSGNA